MPPKNSRRPAKKLSEFKKLQLELNPSQARDKETKLLEPCLPECNQGCNENSPTCLHSGLSRPPIDWAPKIPYDEKVVKGLLTFVDLMCGFEDIFKEEPNGNGKRSLAPMDEFENTFLHLASLLDDPANIKLAFFCILNGLKNKNPRNIEGLTPLHIIAQKGFLEICEVILGCVEDKNPKDSWKNSPSFCCQ